MNETTLTTMDETASDVDVSSHPASSTADGVTSRMGAIDDEEAVEPVNPMPTGPQRMVGWTLGDSSTASRQSRSVRPLHVRLSVRIHHVSFLHPGLDSGGSTLTTNRGKKNKFFKKKDLTAEGAPGPMAFGQKRGSWKNTGRTYRKGAGAVDERSEHKHALYGESPRKMADAAEVAEIISQEAFRLSRDGIIQQHCALRNASEQREAKKGKQAELAETARYYSECASRPKGYRRLVVSSLLNPTDEEKIPRPPVKKRVSSFGWDAREEDDVEKEVEEEKDSFDNVEYRYIGPPNTGPAFFQLLRQHGAASFGRFLPEVACSVPKHSIGFELRKKSKGLTNRGASASTQPIVVEAPYVIWGDARDKTLSKIAQEGCPLIDARPFEYASNANLKDTELSETLMVCGATVWVKNAPDDDDFSIGTTSTLRSRQTKAMVKAEYYGGKIADGVKDGVKGVALGTKEVFEGVKKTISPVHKDKAVDGSASVTSDNTEAKKKKKTRVSFIPKKFKRKKKKASGAGDDVSINSNASMLDEMSVGSQSVGATEAMTMQDTTISEIDVKSPIAEERTDQVRFQDDEEVDSVHSLPGNSMHSRGSVHSRNSMQVKKSPEYNVVKSVPYILILDDIINIQIVSFPDKDVIAKFPISVASVMVQRSVQDRLQDPLKPSELTATLIQEPSAPKLQWGVELKITIRAVEVKPQVPRVVLSDMSPSLGMDTFTKDLKNFRDKMVSLGKSQEEIEKAVIAKERELLDMEHELDLAIVSAGFGKGEHGGANPEDIRKRQMFYDEREHKSAERAVMARRGRLSVSQRNMLTDARLDPSIMVRKDSELKEQKIISILDNHFPGVEEGSEFIRASNRRELLSMLKKIDESETESVDSKPVDTGASRTGDVFASMSLAIAESLDDCLGEHLDVSTVEIIKQSLNEQIPPASPGESSEMTASAAKQWCSDISHRLSLSSSALSVNSREFVSHLQNVLVVSAGGVAAGSPTVSKSETQEEAVSPEVSQKLSDWCASLVRKLESCVEDIEDQDFDESTHFSARDKDDDSKSSEESIDELAHSTNRLSAVKRNIDSAYDAIDSTNFTALVADQKKRNEADDSDSVKSDDDLWKQATYQKQTRRSSNMERLLKASTTSTFNEAIPAGMSVSASQIEPLLKSMRNSHFDVHCASINAGKGQTKVSSPEKHLQSKPDNVAKKLLGGVEYLVLVIILISVGVFLAFKYIFCSEPIARV